MILKREQFIKLMFPYSYSIESIENIDLEIEKIIKNYQIPKSKILCPFCSVGSYAISFAKKGFDVTASDGFDYIDLARKKSEELNVNVRWEKKNYFEKYNQSYSYIFCLGYSYGFFESLEHDQKILCNFLDHLKPGGMIFFQLIGRDLLEKYFNPKFWIKQVDNSYLLNEREIDYSNGFLQEKYTYIKGDNVEEFKFGSKVYYPFEIVELLKKCGFKNLKTYGSLDKSEYDDKAQCLFVSAQKEISQNNFIRC